MPKRWVVERTYAWTERWRLTVRHRDRTLDISAAWVWLAERVCDSIVLPVKFDDLVYPC